MKYENEINELFEIAEALLAWSDLQRDLADAKPTEALELRLNAAEHEAEALEVLRELIDARGAPYSPRPTTRRNPEELLQKIASWNTLKESARFSPPAGSPRSPSKRTPTEACHQSQAEAPELTGAPPCGAFIPGRTATLYQFERPALKRA
jgi:hypothetical protein